MPGSRVNADAWINEYISPADIYQHGIEKVLAFCETEYQQMYIVRSETQGMALVLDGKWQSCERDEFLYHEPLVHVAAVNHGKPKSVLVLGGGEGATVREALKWNSVERVVMVDIDGEVVEACKQHLEVMHRGAFDDPRTELVIGDALDYLDESESEYDIIISDLSDPIEEGPSFKLFTKEYFEKCKRALKPDGYFVLQAGPLAPNQLPLHIRLNKTVGSVFAHTASFGSTVPTYATAWGFVLGSDEPIELNPDPVAIDAMLATQTTGRFKMFDGRALLGLMHPPKHIRDGIEAETEVYTLAAPPKFFGKGHAGD